MQACPSGNTAKPSFFEIGNPELLLRGRREEPSSTSRDTGSPTASQVPPQTPPGVKLGAAHRAKRANGEASLWSTNLMSGTLVRPQPRERRELFAANAAKPTVARILAAHVYARRRFLETGSLGEQSEASWKVGRLQQEEADQAAPLRGPAPPKFLPRPRINGGVDHRRELMREHRPHQVQIRKDRLPPRNGTLAAEQAEDDGMPNRGNTTGIPQAVRRQLGLERRGVNLRKHRGMRSPRLPVGRNTMCTNNTT